MSDLHDWLSPIVDAVRSHALVTGRFESFNGFEPPPGTTAQPGITGACWPLDVQPAARASGLRATAPVLAMNVRLYTPGQAEPRDAVDPQLLAAASHLFTAYHGDLSFGGLVRNVDVFGAVGGWRLRLQTGWVPSTRERIIMITLPLVLGSVWQQSRGQAS